MGNDRYRIQTLLSPSQPDSIGKISDFTRRTQDLLVYICLDGLIYQATVPCPLPEQLLANTIDHQQYVGNWYFKAAVSHREADIRNFKALDSIRFTIEKTANDTLLLTGHMRTPDNCVKQTWTYHIHPDRDDLELEGKTERRNLLWNGKWANCSDCIIFQEVEPPLTETDSVDSLHRFMLYSRQRDVDSEVVTTFLKNAACNNMLASVTLPQEKGSCRSHGRPG